MDWSYLGAINGSIALNGGAAPRIGGSAQTRAQYAVVRLLPGTTGARSVLADVVRSWELPGSITSARDLEPGTWILADVEGSIGLTVGATYGFSMDWIREARAGGLSGDIGLKVKAGIEAALGFSAAGRFLVVVARESLDPTDHLVRVRVFKRTRRGLRFALNAGASLTPVNDAFPEESYDALVAAMLGLDGNQLLGALEGLREWTNPAKVADNLLGLLPTEDVVAEAEAFLTRLLPGPLKGLSFDEARDEIVAVLDRWMELDHEVAALIWSKVGVDGALDRLREVAQRIEGLGSDGIEKVLTKLLEGVGLDSDPALEWIRELVGETNVAQLLESSAIKKIGEGAEQLLAVLDEGKIESIFSEIHQLINRKLKVQEIRDWVAGSNLQDLDSWLRGRVERFLDGALSDSGLQEVQAFVTTLDSKKQALYKGINDALKREYSAKLQVAYESASDRTALIDVTVDTAKPGGRDVLASAIAGRFGEVFGSASSALTIGVGELTHGVETRLDASLSLPFFERSVKKVTRSVAKLEVEAGAGGEVRLLFALDAKNRVEYNNTVRSQLSVAGVFATKDSGVRQWSMPRAATSYEFTVAKKQVLRPRLEQILRPLAETYLKEEFEPVAGQASGLSAWLSDVDRTVEEIEHNGADNFGNVVIRLSVAVPPSYLAAWSRAPESESSALWRTLSVELQRAMRRVLVSTLTADREFMNSGMLKVAGLLTYGALREDWGVGLFSDGSIGWRMFKESHWAWSDPALLEAVVRDRETLARLQTSLTRLHPALRAGGEVGSGTLNKLAPEDTGRLASTAISDIGDPSRGQPLGTLQSLLFVEEKAIQAAIEAGRTAARFNRLKRGDSTQALEALSDFGGQITEAFNEKLKGRLWRKALPAAATELFMAAARSFDPTLQERGRAVLELFILDQNADFPPDDLGAVGVSDMKHVILQQRVVS